MRKKLKFVALFFVSITILIAVPVNIKNALEKMSGTSSYISTDTLEATNFIEQNAFTTATIMLNPADFSEEHPIVVSALSSRRLYLADEGFATQTLNNPTERMRVINEVYANGNLAVLTQSNIDYLYIKKNMQGSTLSKSLAKQQPVFENATTAIYSVNN